MKKHMQKFCTFYMQTIALLLLSVAGIAQNVVTGKVTDSRDGSPLQGVTVTVKGTQSSTQTLSDGSFRITTPSGNRTLVFSSIGFTNQELPATGGTVGVSLVGSSQQLNEVVVVGYGTTRKKDLTGSIATVSAKDFQKGVISTPEQMIAGKVSGVSIISNDGRPGSGSTIRIRGGSSLNASNDPLIVIDGVPLDNDQIPGAANPLSFINSNDIETFTVLKDASAAAIYGTRASNGVIIITTKKGRSGALKVNFSTVNSISKITKEIGVLSGDQLRSIVNENGTATQKNMLGNVNTNWQDQIYQNAFSTDNNISITGGIKNLPYRVSIGYMNQTGILRTDNLQKNSLAIAINPVLFDNHLKIDINLKGSMEKVRFAESGAIGGAISFDPTKPVTVNSPRYGGYYEWIDTISGKLNINAGRNPLGLLNQKVDKASPERSIGNIQLDYKLHFFPDLHANLNLGYDVARSTGSVFISDSAAANYTTSGYSKQSKNSKANTLVEFYLNYVKDIQSIKSRVDVVAGYSYNHYLSTYYSYKTYDAHGKYVTDGDSTHPFNKPEHNLISFFGRANYTFNDKYLLTGTIRRDGSSRFAPNFRWGTFPSVALAWKIKEESFLKRSNTVSDLKLRLGYGITGQQDGIGNYDYLSYYSLSTVGGSYYFGDTYYQGFRPGGFYANRKWEETATTNIALDYGLFNNRISGSVDFYLKKTKNLLNSIPQPAGTNFSAYILANVGSMENKGVEFNLNTQVIKASDASWDANFNLTYNKNSITNLTVLPDDPNYIGFPSTNINGAQGFAFLNAVGSSKNTFYLYQQVYDKSGKPLEGVFVDQNGDGIINENDKYKGRRADPNLFLGFSTNFSYKKLSAGFVLRASFNNYVYNNIFSNNGRLNQIIGGTIIGNASTNYLTTFFEGNSDKQLLSDYYIENASFLRMDNLNVGYDFGKIVNNKALLRATFSVQNVFVITKYKGLDPEIGNGVDNNNYPRPRVYSLGLNLLF
ncbi:MAG: TonB-dependent receptor [Ferruginibacter sp.]